MKIFLDADACPVTDIIIETAKEKEIKLILVKNYTQIIEDEYPEIVTVDISNDSADFYIINRLKDNDLVITNDKGLSALAISRNSYVMDFFGNIINEKNIDLYLNMRHINAVNRKRGIYSKNRKRSLADNSNFKKNLLLLLEEIK